jgi:L-asparaginase II
MIDKNPLIIEVTRGGMVESRHLGSAVVVDARGNVRHAWGDVDRLIYPRSAIKPLQTIVLVESGAAAACGATPEELAFASASHNGEHHHIDGVTAWLSRMGLSPNDLECAPHWPHEDQTLQERLAEQPVLDNASNNCSGKHAGFLATAQHLGEDLRGYNDPEHPVQRRLKALLSELGEVSLDGVPTGIDGCGIPVMGMPLSSMALALAKMADPSELTPIRRTACEKISAAIMAHPYNVAGQNRFNTIAMQSAPGRFVVKTGAEAVHAGIIPELGLGFAIKIDDGTKRACDVLTANLMDFLGVLDDNAKVGLKKFLVMPLQNAAGLHVGDVRMQSGWAG